MLLFVLVLVDYMSYNIYFFCFLSEKELSLDSPSAAQADLSAAIKTKASRKGLLIVIKSLCVRCLGSYAIVMSIFFCLFPDKRPSHRIKIISEKGL